MTRPFQSTWPVPPTRGQFEIDVSHLNRVLVEAERQSLEEAGEVAEHFLVVQPEVEHDHVIDVVVRQEVEQRPVFLRRNGTQQSQGTEVIRRTHQRATEKAVHEKNKNKK